MKAPTKAKVTIQSAAWLFVIALVAGAIWLGATVAQWLHGIISSEDSAVVTTSVAAFATVFASVLTVVLGQRSIKAREITQAHRDAKTELYSNFINQTVDLLKQTRRKDEIVKYDQQGKPVIDSELERFMFDFHAKLILWGSPSVIQKYLRFRAESQKKQKDGSTLNTVLLVDDIFRAMRKDLGGKCWSLERGSFILLFLKEHNLSKLDEVAT
ncbi:MAG: hypothetical protein AAF085_11560 [Planctomycetota bacterium]